jgi:TatD DNase family protein
MKLVDTHCHLESEQFRGRLDTIINDAKDASIVKIITSSISPGQWEESRAIANRFDEVEYALGVHPWYTTPSDLDIIYGLGDEAKKGAIAIGETGLDKKIDNPDLEIQIKIFEIQLSIAREVNLPLIIHCRGAFNELMNSFKRVGVPDPGGVIHSFSGSRELAEELLKFNMNFSLGGILTYKKSSKRIRLLRKIYPRHFLLETDSPDIPPVQVMDKPNVPANIMFNLKAAAELLEESIENVAENTTANAVRIFNLEI